MQWQGCYVAATCVLSIIWPVELYPCIMVIKLVVGQLSTTMGLVMNWLKFLCEDKGDDTLLFSSFASPEGVVGTPCRGGLCIIMEFSSPWILVFVMGVC